MSNSTVSTVCTKTGFNPNSCKCSRCLTEETYKTYFTDAYNAYKEENWQGNFDTDTDTDTHTDTDTDTDTYTYTNTDTDTDTYRYTDTDTYTIEPVT